MTVSKKFFFYSLIILSIFILPFSAYAKQSVNLHKSDIGIFFEKKYENKNRITIKFP